MTIIAAMLDKPNKRAIIASDSNGSNQYWKIDFGSKLVRLNENIVVGFSDSYVIADWLKYEAAEYIKDEHDINKAVRKLAQAWISAAKNMGHGHIDQGTFEIPGSMLVATSEQLFRIQSNGVIYEPQMSYTALGSGQDMAIGALEMASRLKLDPCLAVSQAISIAMFLNPYCGGNIHIQMVGK